MGENILELGRKNIVLILLAIFAGLAFGAIYYKNSKIEKEIADRLQKLDGVQYSNIDCSGIVSISCTISDMQFPDEELTIREVKISDIEKLYGLEHLEKDGKYPFHIEMNDFTSPQIEEFKKEDIMRDSDTISLVVSGVADVESGKIALDLQTSIDLTLTAITLSTQLHIDSKDEPENIGFQHISLSLTDRELLDRLYQLRKKDKPNITMDEYREELTKEFRNMLSDYPKIADEVEKFISTDSDTLELSISTKSGKYISFVELFLGYQFASIGGVAGIENYIDSNLKIEVKAK